MDAEIPAAAAAPPKLLERRLSIETEPKTLLGEEMKLAREAALKVINGARTREEAWKIFQEGMKPAGSAVEQKHVTWDLKIYSKEEA